MTVKLVPFDTDTKFIQGIADELQEFIAQEEIKNIVVLYEMKDGTIKTAKCCTSRLALMGLCNVAIHQACKDMMWD